MKPDEFNAYLIQCSGYSMNNYSFDDTYYCLEIDETVNSIIIHMDDNHNDIVHDVVDALVRKSILQVNDKTTVNINNGEATLRTSGPVVFIERGEEYDYNR
jgi:hypothetical protein